MAMISCLVWLLSAGVGVGRERGWGTTVLVLVVVDYLSCLYPAARNPSQLCRLES